MANKFSFPHVNVTTTLLKHNAATKVKSTGTRLFVPFVSNKGPENRVVEIDSFATFKNTFGTFDYTVLGQEQILNIGQWLSNGGVVLAFRMTDNLDLYIDADANGSEVNVTDLVGYASGTLTTNTSEQTIEISAEYPGSEYSGYEVIIEPVKSELLNATETKYMCVNITVNDKTGNAVERKRNVSIFNLESYCRDSDYISSIKLLNDNKEISTVDEFNTLFTSNSDTKTLVSKTVLLEISSAYSNDTTISSKLTTEQKSSESTPEKNYQSTIKSVLNYALRSKLETPCDAFIDPGYPDDVKKELLKFFCGTSDETLSNYHRNDIMLYLSHTIISAGKYSKLSDIKVNDSAYDDETVSNFNCKMYTQYFKGTDIYSNIDIEREVCYPLTYYVAGIQPYIDRKYGRQQAPAGVEYGFIGTSSEIKWINKIPSNIVKQAYHDDKLNYCEKDGDSFSIMEDLTFVSQNDALYADTAFCNGYAVRSAQLMKRELTSICRPYLKTKNDAIGRRQLENECNAYMDKWINNRTLKSYTVQLLSQDDDPTLEGDEIAVVLTVKFNRDINIIDLSFTIGD